MKLIRIVLFLIISSIATHASTMHVGNQKLSDYTNGQFYLVVDREKNEIDQKIKLLLDAAEYVDYFDIQPNTKSLTLASEIHAKPNKNMDTPSKKQTSYTAKRHQRKKYTYKQAYQNIIYRQCKECPVYTTPNNVVRHYISKHTTNSSCALCKTHYDTKHASTKDCGEARCVLMDHIFDNHTKIRRHSNTE